MLTQIDNQLYDNLVDTINTKAGTSGVKNLVGLKEAVESIGGGVQPLVPPTAGDGKNYIYFQAEDNGATLSFRCPRMDFTTSAVYNVFFEISTDGQNWTAWEYNDISSTYYASETQPKNVTNRYFKPIVLQHRGDYVFVRAGGNSQKNDRLCYPYAFNEIDASYYATHFITTNGRISVGGNIMSLLDGNVSLISLASVDYGFYGLFESCNITTLPQLPATELCEQCYANMFKNCYNLKTIPSGYFSATTTLSKGCYKFMFSSCTSLSSIPSGLLPATTLSEECYSGMFSNCVSLTKIPRGLLPAMNLTGMCYSKMFNGCSSLTVVPSDLISRVRNVNSNSCDGMFCDCSSLTIAPEIYIPDGVVESSNAFGNMFNGCLKLNSLKLLNYPNFTRWANSITFYWLSGVSINGTLYCNETTFSIPTGNPSGLPGNWIMSNY